MNEGVEARSLPARVKAIEPFVIFLRGWRLGKLAYK